MGEPGARTQSFAVRALRAATDPLARAAVTLTRPATYAAQLREAAAAAATVGLWPLGVGAGSLVADERSPSPDRCEPVLLLHGYGANRSNWHFVERRLRSAGFDSVHALNYNPLTTDLPGLASWFADEVSAVQERFGMSAVHVVGHSLGGVVARYAIQVLGVDGVATCVTLASPHGGVRLARHTRPLPGGLAAVARQLRPDSPEMVLLRSSARPLATRFVAYGAGSDLIVPAARALIRESELGATNLLVPHLGHFSLLFSRAVADSLTHHLHPARRPAPAVEALPVAA